MEYKLKELLDIPKLQSLLDSLDEIYSIPSAIIDIDGNILTRTAWQDICTRFHRANPESEKECIESDTHIVSELSKGKTQVVYKCPKGLVDTATPIVVGGKHIGNAFTGQFFLDPPDEGHFRALAKKYGFDEEDYIEAMRRVPVITEDKHRKNLKVLSKLTEMLAEMGLRQKQQIEIERRLTESNLRLNSILDTVPQAIFWKDSDGVYLGCNAVFAKAVGLDRVDQIRGKTDFDLPWPKEEAEGYRKDDNEVITSKREKMHIIEPLQQADGTRLWIDTSKVPLLDQQGNVFGVLGVYEDITKRKEAEERLSKSLQEKELLLKEIHHRVKNNMAIISALLHLQNRYIRNEELNRIFTDSQNRIRSMALLHEKLYSTQDLANLSFNGYIRELAAHLFDTYGNSVALELSTKDIHLNIDTMIPLGLILNELITNSLKHAFEKTENPGISISLHADDRNATLVYADNGIGLSEDINMDQDSTLGLQLVKMLAFQLKGRVDIERTEGTRFRLNFVLPEQG